MDVDPIPVAPKLSKRFYEALLLLSILGKNRGDRIKEDVLLDLEGRDTRPLPPFLRSLAYLCDFEKGGDSTTAIALQKTPQCVVYWFATNKHANSQAGVVDKTKTFLQDVLSTLKNVNWENMKVVESELFSKAVNFSCKRIAEYTKMLGTALKHVLDYLEKLGPNKDPFRDFLQEIKDALNQPSKLCRMCHEINPSHNAHFTTLELKAASGEPCQKNFKSVRHTIGRLNHTPKAVKTVVITALTERQLALFDDFKVVRVLSSRKSPPPLQDRKPTLAAIAGRLLSGPINIASLREKLQELDQKFDLSERLREEYSSTTWRPRVHAELIILDKFWTHDFEFVARERYIGCSKPACYCCYHYIHAHPGQFVVPHSSNNNYLNWKAPDIYESDSALIKMRENILNEMTKKIRIDVLTQIQEKRGPAQWQPDSATEISTARFENVRWPSSESSSNDVKPGDISNGRIEDSGGEERISGKESESEDEDDEVGGVSLLGPVA